MKKIISTVIIFMFGILLPIACSAKSFTENGYDISMKWRQSNDKFMIKGDIKNGEKCKKLKLSASFKNTGDKTVNVNIVKSIKYKSTAGKKFKAQDKVKLDLKHKNKWYVENINLECQ